MGDRAADHRIAALDGVRGVAIALVVLFHAYARWVERLPWLQGYEGFPLLAFGYVGVNLFFLLSGYVILMTLERTPRYFEFLGKRWLRLFPAMAIASVLILLSAALFPERPGGAIHWPDALPGLLFIEPYILNRIFQTHLTSLENDFWSLFVEVKFYLIFGAIFYLNKKMAVYAIMIIYAMFWSYNFFMSLGLFNKNDPLETLFFLGSFRYFGWFAVGALFYLARNQRRNFHLLLAALMTGLLVSEPENPALNPFPDMGQSLAYLCCVLIFGMAVFMPAMGRLLAARPWVFLGFVSYPLYLIHENAMVALTVKTHAQFPALPVWMLPLPGLGMLIVVAWAIARYGEPWLRRRLTPWIKPPLDGR